MVCLSTHWDLAMSIGLSQHWLQAINRTNFQIYHQRREICDIHQFIWRQFDNLFKYQSLYNVWKLQISNNSHISLGSTSLSIFFFIFKGVGDNFINWVWWSLFVKQARAGITQGGCLDAMTQGVSMSGFSSSGSFRKRHSSREVHTRLSTYSHLPLPGKQTRRMEISWSESFSAKL